MTKPEVDVATHKTDIRQATFNEADPKTPEVSTDDVRRILADGSAILLDSRKRAEYSAGHIAGARSATPPQGAPVEEFIAAVERLVGGDKATPLVVYCNGEHCKQGRRLAEQLAESGFADVRRYQLGIPVWRALGGPVEIDLDGILRIYQIDRTAIFFDARSAADFAKGSIAGAHSVAADTLGDDGLAKAPLPRNDFNTRVILFGRDGTQARKLADAIGRTPFQNVSYFPGTYEALAAAIKADGQPAHGPDLRPPRERP
jgi:rhodanese-related sulfurtransferase